MFIQTESTPNPATLKFLPGCTVIEQGVADFQSQQEALGKSPLAEALFALQGVRSVFLGRDFVSVSRDDTVDWPILKPPILGVLMEHFLSGRPVLAGSVSVAEPEEMEIAPENVELVGKIRALLDERVRPAVAMDGGDIVFHGYERGVVYLTLRGACAGCPSSTATLKMGIENMLRHYFPEIVEVRARA